MDGGEGWWMEEKKGGWKRMVDRGEGWMEEKNGRRKRMDGGEEWMEENYG